MTKRLFRLWLAFFFYTTAMVNVAALTHSSESNHSYACGAPYGLNTSEILTHAATLVWAHEFTASVSTYELEIRPSTQGLNGTPTHTGISSTSLAVGGLESGRVYRCKVRAVCGTETSDWSSLTYTFRTLLSNPSRCGASYLIRDNQCPPPADQTFPILIENTGDSLGKDVKLKAVRLIVEHSWRSDLEINLTSPDGTVVRLIEGLNAGDINLGNPTVTDCSAYIELTNDADALPLGAMYQVPNPTGRYQPRNPLSAFNNFQNPEGLWKLDLCDKRLSREGSLKWVELVFERADCTPPSWVLAQNIARNTADISWDKSAVLCDSFIVEWGLNGFLPGNGRQKGNGAGILVVPCSVNFPLTLTGLTAFQSYDVYVRNNCGTDLYAQNSAAAHFFTDCPPTLEEKFDGQALCDKSCDAPCSVSGVWQNLTVGDNYDWKIWTGAGPSTPSTGPYLDADGSNGNYLYFETTCSPNSKDSTAILRSRCIQVMAPSAQDCHFGYDYFMWNISTATSLGKLSVEISTDGGLNWAVLKTYNGSQGKGWKHESINLSAFHNQIAVLRFVATGSVSQTSDIALDNIRFYGSSDVGAPDFTFYRDLDGDGFGNLANPFISCFPNIPTGYVGNSGDCDDSNPTVYPNSTEVTCNGIDENCNGNTDDRFIVAPVAVSTSACMGSAATLRVSSSPKGSFYWYDANGNLLQIGGNFNIPNLAETITYFVLDSMSTTSGTCASAKTPVTAEAYPTPSLLFAGLPQICSGETLDLTTLPVFDQQFSNGTLTYHTANPPTNGNRLPSTWVSPAVTTPYFIVSTTANGCTDMVEANVEVNPVPLVGITTGDSTTLCRNASKLLLANASGGTPPFQYQWSNGLNFKSINIQGNPIGNVTDIYTVVVEDSLGCKNTDFIKVRTLNSISQTTIDGVQNASVCGGNDGSITLSPLNGTFPVAFSWTGATSGTMSGITGTTTIPGLKQGNYRITVTDNTPEGCQMVMPLLFVNAPGLQVALDTIQNPTCYGSSTGSIKLDVQGTNPTYNWSNGMQSRDINQVSAGTYAVTIADGACQQILENLEVKTPDSIKILQNKVTDVSCFGLSNGAVDVAVFGGTGEYQTIWSNDQTSEDIGNLVAGWYECIVTDGLGCSNSARFFVPQPAPISLSILEISPIKCHGERTGELMANSSGGTGNLQYAWQHGPNTASVNNLQAGTYQVTVQDENACSKTLEKTIAAPNPLVFDSIQVKQPFCSGSDDGQIRLVPTGGTPGYLFSWNTGNSTNIQTNLSPGTYSITLSDANGCTNSVENLQITANQLLSLRLDSLAHVRCHGETNGSIAITVNGGQAPLTFKWNEAPGNSVLENLFPGQFRVVARDARGCMISDTFEVLQPEMPLAAGVIAKNNPRCFGEFGGSIEVHTEGGTAPYSFEWNNAANSESISELPIGVYRMTVTDANGCTSAISPEIISQPSALNPVVAPHDIPCGGAKGYVELFVEGGIPNYHYAWNTGDTTQNIYDLLAGYYAVTIKDNNGCLAEFDSVAVVNTNLNFNISPEIVQNISCYGKQDGQIVVQLSGGTAPFRYNWSHQTPAQNSVTSPFKSDTVIHLAPGNYKVIAIDAGGCITPEKTFAIEEPVLLTWQPASLTMVHCKGDSTGEIQTSILGGFPPYYFDWDNAPDVPNPAQLAAGVYSATVTDFNNCPLLSPPITLTEPVSGVFVETDSLWNDNCGQCKGAVFIRTSGGSAPYEYLWSNGATVQDITNVCPDNYSVTVTDHAGCSKTLEQQINTGAFPLDLNTDITHIACRGDSSGFVRATPMGGIPGYMLTWSNGEQGETAHFLPAGTNTVTLTDAAGCIETFSILIEEPNAALSFQYQADSSANGWTLFASVVGGVAPYTVKWFDNNGVPVPNPTNLPSGIYHAIVTDANGCRLEVNNIVLGTVGTADAWGLEKVRISPNPTNGKFLLEINSLESTEVRVEISNAQGQLVENRHFSEKRRDWSMVFDLENKAAGIYFVKIRDNMGRTKVWKVVSN